MTYQLPPLNNAEIFEDLVRDILRRVYDDPGIEKFGRRGQSQHGIDGYSPANSGVTFQCKLKDIRYDSNKSLRETLITEIETELGKTEGLDIPPKRFIFASTYKNDTHLQQKAQTLSNKTITVEYWGWDTINEKIWDHAEALIPIYYPQCPVRRVPGFRQIKPNMIKKAHIDDSDVITKLSMEYYRINDRDDIVFKVVCNNIDVRNSEVMENIFSELEALSHSGTLWILGDGGSGKTTILNRAAIELSLNGKDVYFFNLEAHLSRDDLMCALSLIKYCNTSEQVVLCIDNPASDEEILELLLRQIPDFPPKVHILLVERVHRYHAIKNLGGLSYLHGEEEHEPIIVRNSHQQRKDVYDRLFKLLGISDADVKSLREIGLNEKIVYVNATYTILLDLKKKRKIDFDFDWDDYAKLTKDLPAFRDGYKYIAIFYLFGVKALFSVLSKICGADDNQQKIFLERFRGLVNEPVVVEERRDTLYRKQILLRTKHEIVSEIYFREHPELNRNELMMAWCEYTEFEDDFQSQALVNILGAKKNYSNENYQVDFQLLIDFLLNGYLRYKVKLSRKLYETLHIANFWLLLSQNNTEKAIAVLESSLREVPENLHYRTELSKIYQRQGTSSIKPNLF
ncbi:MAG: hypothetical protein ACNYWU_08150 [Desulfobacterales bacterium]